jgi:hypothetical protein
VEVAKGDDGIPDDRGTPESDQLSEIDRLIAENEQMKARLRRRGVWRRALTGLLVVLTSLSVVATTFAVWVHQTVFDTDRFMGTISPALEDPALYDALGNKVSAQVLDALDLEVRVTESLAALDDYISQALLDALDVDERARQLLARFDRPSLTALAPPIVEGLEERIDRRVDAFFRSEQFTTRLPQLVRRAHEVTVALLRDDLAEVPNVYVAQGEVRLNLIPIIGEVLRQVAGDLRGFLPEMELPDVLSDVIAEGREQIAAAIEARLPEDFGQLTVMSQQALLDAQSGAERLDRYVWALLVLSIALVVVTILVSQTRRRTSVQIALGVVLGITIAAVIVRRVEAAIIEGVVSPDGEVAARALLGGVLSNLRAIELIVALAAVVVAIIAYLAGGPAWLIRARARFDDITAQGPDGSELDQWVTRNFDWLRLTLIGLAVLVFFVVGFGWISVLVISLVLALGLWLMGAARARVGAVEQTAAHELVEGGSDVGRGQGAP